MKILIIEDETRLADAIRSRLEREKFEVEVAGDGLDGLSLARFGQFEVIILDLMLPGVSGMEILEELRHTGTESKVIILTAKSSLRDKLEGFEGGADDYLTKPFQMEELVARVRRLGREVVANGDLKVGNTVLDQREMSLRNVETEEGVEVMSKEFRLLEMFFENPEIVFEKQRIFDKIWGIESESSLNSVEAYVSFVRKKLKLIDANLRIRAVRNLGYKLEIADGKDKA